MSVDDRYTYPGSGGVLRNNLDIDDRDTLDRAMNKAASYGWARLIDESPPIRLDFEYLSYIHRTMFFELFSWAGQVRDVDTGAENTGIIYARPAFIESELATLFRTLESENYLANLSDRDDFAAALADRWGHLTQIHPFRDGNTRSQSVFVSQMARRAGHFLDWRLVDVQELRHRRLRAVAGHESELADYLRRVIH